MGGGVLTTLCMKHPGLLDAAILCAVSPVSNERETKDVEDSSRFVWNLFGWHCCSYGILVCFTSLFCVLKSLRRQKGGIRFLFSFCMESLSLAVLFLFHPAQLDAAVPHASIYLK